MEPASSDEWKYAREKGADADILQDGGKEKKKKKVLNRDDMYKFLLKK